MDEAKYIVRLNIEHYKRLLATETDPNKRQTITRLLAEQEATLQEIEQKERRRVIVRLNIEYYEQLLTTEASPHMRRTITRLLAEQEAELQEMERKERGD